MNEAQRATTRIAGKLLHTKLMAPRLPETIITRGGLLTRLDEGLSKKLIVVAAPTGFGKTTLVSSWIAARDFASAWVTLDPNDNDPVRFWTYVITALRGLDTSPGKNALAALLTAQPVALPSILTLLVNDLARLSSTSVLVLEDFQAITSSEVQSSVAFLIQNLPQELHVVLISRNEPQLPLGILRARGVLVEIDAASLHFSVDETADFLRAALSPSLGAASLGAASLGADAEGDTISSFAASKLHERTEGWAAGLRLAAQWLQSLGGGADLDQLVRSFSGSHRFVSEYLIQEVFASQPERVQEFLIQTSYLSRLTGPLCDAVTRSADGAVLLDQLERDNLFLVQLGDYNGLPWYRYYALFAESIQALARRKLGEEGVRAVFERASGWYERQGLLDEAIETALHAGLFERAMRLIEGYLEQHNLSEAFTLGRWLEQIPDGQIEAHPKLCFTYAQVMLYTLDRFAPVTAARLEPLLQASEQAWQAAGEVARLGELHAFRGQVVWWQGDVQKAFEYARQSLQELPEEDVMYRGMSLLLASSEALEAGRILDAQDHALEARALLGAAQNMYGVLAAAQMLSEIFYWQGELEQADQINRQILAEALESTGGESMLDDRGIATLGMANAAYERNDLAQAEPLAQQAIDLAQRRGNEMLQMQATARLAGVRAARGNLEDARKLLRTLAAGMHSPVWLREIQTAQALLAIRARETTGLDGWLALATAEQKDLLLAQKEREAFTLARWHLLTGKFQAALNTLDGWQEDAARQGRVRSQVEALCLAALAYEQGGDRSQAARALTQALRIGQAKGFRRMFLDEGPRMAALIQAVLPMLANRSLNVYASTLLHSFSPEMVTTPGPGETNTLVEPLSQQELRVLRLLAAGLSNAEIASELIVSRNTVKTQVQSIYRKLNVNSRDEARQVARELNLI
jgi:LuxR family transcriptional regulator, maltose regulon positive regulatory protein